MKWRVKPPGIIATSSEGYKIHISGFEVLTYIAIAPSHKHRPERIGRFNEKEQAKACCEKHLKGIR